MVVYWRWGDIFALHAEMSIESGASPLLDVTILWGEILIDFPYGQVIFSPPKALKAERRRNDGQKRD